MDNTISEQRLYRNNGTLDFEAMERRLDELLAENNGVYPARGSVAIPYIRVMGKVPWWQRWLTRLGIIQFLMKHPRLYHPSRHVYHRLRR